MSDYINREDALKSIDTRHNESVKEYIRTFAEEYYEYKGGIDYAYETIKHDVPAADVMPVVHGHWITEDDGFWCSNCRAYANWQRRKYCPDCGAKMDEVSE